MSITIGPIQGNFDVTNALVDYEVMGDNGANQITTGQGQDTLIGGQGNDELTGGWAGDYFVFKADSGTDGIDRIHADASDTVLLSNVKLSELSWVSQNASTDTVVLNVGPIVTVANRQYLILDHASDLGGLTFTSGVDGASTTLAQLLSAPTPGLNIVGGSGNDSLRGGAGADTLQGGAGNDTLLGGPGNDDLYGGGGNDLFEISTLDGDDTVHGDATDRIQLQVNRDGLLDVNLLPNQDVVLILKDKDTGLLSTVTVPAGQESTSPAVYFQGGYTLPWRTIQELAVTHGKYFEGGALADTITGADTNDTLQGMAGNDSLDGGLGDDFLWGGDGRDTLQGGLGKDFLWAEGGNDLVMGGEGDDQMDGGDGNDTLLGGNGQDSLWGGAGNDDLSGGAGADTIYIFPASGDDVAHLEPEDALFLGANLDTVMSSPLQADDTVKLYMPDWSGRPGGGTVTLDNVSSLLGIRVDFQDSTSQTLAQLLQLPIEPVGVQVDGLDAADTLMGGTGNDTLNGWGGNDLLQGSAGNDLLSGGQGQDDLRGGAGNDTLRGDSGQDSLYGNDGDDVLEAGFDAIDRLDGGAGNDTLTGQTLGDVLIGGAGADKIVLRQTVTGAARYEVHADGQDTIVFEGATQGWQESAAARSSLRYLPDETQLTLRSPMGVNFHHAELMSGATLVAGADGSQISFDALLQSARAQGFFAQGTELSERLQGDVGSDILSGLGGHDTLEGLAGQDELQGGNGDDILRGGDGDDVLDGGAGNDVLDGGSGTDLFLLDAALSPNFAGAGRDTLVADGQDGLQYNAPIDLSKLVARFDNNGRSLEIYSEGGSQSAQVVYVEDFRSLDGATIQNNRGDVLTVDDLYRRSERSVVGVVEGFQGADFMQGFQGKVLIHGGAGNDTIYGGGGNDTIYGDGGDDKIDGGGYTHNTLLGGEGNDTLSASRAGDTLEGGAGADLYFVTGTAQRVGVDVIRADNLDRFQFEFKSREQLLNANAPGAWQNAVEISAAGTDLLLDGIGSGIRIEHVDQALSATVSTYDSAAFRLEEVVNAARQHQIRWLGTDAAESLTGDVGGDLLRGRGGNDVLLGLAGDDNLYGDAGNDTLTGGLGADTYHLSTGDGQDLVHADGQDMLWLHNTTRDQLTIGRLGASGADSVLLGVGSGDSVLLDKASTLDGLTLQFADGSTMLWKDVMAEATKAPPNLALNGTAGNDTLTGGGGNDTLSGLAGNDNLSGAAGKDSLNGGLGADTLSGGLGNDTLVGDKGNDTYLFARGDGMDTIVDKDSTFFNSDALKIANAKSNQLWFTRSGNNLNIAIIGTTDKVTIQDWYTSSANRVEKITALGDNKTLNLSRLSGLVSAMAGFTNQAMAGTDLPASTSNTLSKLITSSWTPA
jgi:Ca2+-binding RTX toxin-like protein